MTALEDVLRLNGELARLRRRRAGNVAIGIVLGVCVVYIASQVGIAFARGRLTHIPRTRTEAWR